jgi:putative endonuclease
MHHNYYVYIITNITRTVLYTGVTNDLERRIAEHKENKGNQKTFAGRYNCFILIYWERFSDSNVAINREKEIKKFSRARKVALINSINKDWLELNEE